MTRRTRCTLALLAVTPVIVLMTRSARAVNPFEIEVYDGTANSPGSPGSSST